MSTYRVPKCERHFVKFDDVTIYPVLVVARTGGEWDINSAQSLSRFMPTRQSDGRNQSSVPFVDGEHLSVFAAKVAFQIYPA